MNTESPRRFLFGFVWCLLFLQVFVLYASDPYAIRLNKSNGLPSNAVYGLFQDSKGFIWISSDEGLSMYDGFKYTTFKADFQSSTAGSCIQEDAFGRIWYENFDGYLYYVDANRKVLSAIEQTSSIGFVPYGITKNHLFVFQKKGIDVYKINDLSFLKTIPLEVERLEHALSDGKNYFFISSDALYKVSENLEISKSNFVFDSNEKTKQLYRDKNTFFVVSKFNEASKLYRFDSQMKLVKTLALTKPKFIHGAHFIDDKFWISTPEGCVVINGNGNQETYYPSKSISSVMKDRQNNYWFATTNEGLFVVPDLKNTVHTMGNFKPSKIIKLNDKSFIIGTKKGGTH